MNAATILKSKGSGVVTTTADKSLLDIAKLLVSIGDLVKMHIADAEFESGATRHYITAA